VNTVTTCGVDTQGSVLRFPKLAGYPSPERPEVLQDTPNFLCEVYR